MYFIFVYQYGRRRINAIFGSDDDSKSNLSFSDVNVDADLSDIEVQEFSKEESGESVSEDRKSDNNSIASDEPESFNFRCLHFLHGRRGSCSSASFFLFVRSSSQKRGIDTYFGSSLMYLFVMLLFVNRNALDRSTRHLISHLTSHTNDRRFIAMKAKA